MTDMAQRYPCQFDKTPEEVRKQRPCVECELGIRRDKRGKLCIVRLLQAKVKELEEQIENQKLIIEDEL